MASVLTIGQDLLTNNNAEMHSRILSVGSNNNFPIIPTNQLSGNDIKVDYVGLCINADEDVPVRYEIVLWDNSTSGYAEAWQGEVRPGIVTNIITKETGLVLPSNNTLFGLCYNNNQIRNNWILTYTVMY